jgi:hypothetical protein
MDAGRPKANHSENADVHGRLKESRLDVPTGWPYAPNPYDEARFDALDKQVQEALYSWIQANVTASVVPQLSEQQILNRFGQSLPYGAIRGAMWNLGYLTPTGDLNRSNGPVRFNATLVSN